MSQCTDPNLGRMLYAYELNGLNEENRRAFEEHLIDCGFCFDQVHSFDQETYILRSDQLVKREIADMDSDSTPAGDSSVESILPKPRTWLNLTIAAAAIIVVLLLNPWELEFRSTSEVVASEPLLAIMYFDNMTETDDQHRLGEMITGLLITDLSESEYVKVVSSQRLYDILALLGHTGVKTVNKDLANRVVEKARANYILTGRLLQMEPTVIITSQLVDAASGNIIASQRILGSEGEDLFTCVDRLSQEVKIDLSLPLEAYAEEDRSLCDLSSCSLDAYRLYLDGIEYSYEGLTKKARESYAAAIEIDSTFCIAYYRLAIASNGDERRQLVNKAVELKFYASKKEQRYIAALAHRLEGDDLKAEEELRRIIRDYPTEKEAHYWLAKLCWDYSGIPEATKHMKAALAIDPQYKPALRSLSTLQSTTGDLEGCLNTRAKYIELYPDDPQGFNSRGATYARYGRFEEAFADWREALRIDPSYTKGVFVLGLSSLILADYRLADSCFEVVKRDGTREQRSDVDLLRCVVPFRGGRVRETLELLNGLTDENLVGEDFRGGSYFSLTGKYSLQATILSSIGRHEEAMEIQNKRNLLWDSLHPGVQYSYTGRYKHILHLAAAGGIDEATEMAEDFRDSLASARQFHHVVYYQALVASGGIEYMKGNYELALIHFRSAAERFDRYNNGDFLLHYMMGKCYQATKKHARAIEEYEDALTRRGKSTHIQYFNHEVDLLINLASVYEAVQDNDNAVNHYRRVQELWAEADEELKQMYGFYEAMERLTRLESQM